MRGREASPAGGWAAFLMLAACASPPADRLPGKPGPAPPPARADADDAPPDWRALLIEPFGTLLKDSPIRLHEVLLFRDNQQGSSEVESRDCYSIDGAPPAFAGLPAESYVLCFEHDRLNRVELAVRMAAADARRVFAGACAQRSKDADPAAAADEVCEGRDGGIAVSVRLTIAPGEGAAELLLSLADAAGQDAQRESPP